VPLKGWKRLGGSAERYLSPDGEIVSRRQYDNYRAQLAGWDNRAQFERRYEDTTYLWAFRKYQRENKMTIQQTRRADRMGGTLSKKLRAAQSTGWGKTKAGRSPHGPMSALLIELHLRDPTATYAVGDTDGPRGRSR
jgi:hypothetical protein